MRVVFTGVAGFIGSALCRHLVLDRRWEVINVGKPTYAASLSALRTIENLASYRFVKTDICDQATVAQVLAAAPMDAIVHLAAESHVDSSIAGPAAFVTTNVVGTFAMLEVPREYWQQRGDERRRSSRFLHVSTDEVFEKLAPEDLFTETTAYAPRSPYSATKAASDHLVSARHHTYGLPVLMTNCSNNYRPNQFPEKLVPLMILKALEMKPLPAYGDGRQERDWLFVDDHVRALT